MKTSDPPEDPSTLWARMERWFRVLGAGAAWMIVASFAMMPDTVRAQSRIDDNFDGQLDAAESADEIAIGANVDESFGVFVVPIPIIDPTIGNGLAIGGLMTFQLDTEDRVSPRSTIAAGVGYTDTESYAFGTGISLYLDEDRYRVGLKGGYGDANLKFYGLGTHSVLQDHPVDFGMRGAFAMANVRGRIADQFYIGPLYKYLDASATFNLVPDIVPRSDLGFRLSGVGLIAEYDSRDTSFSPHDGIHGEAELVGFGKQIGSDFNFFSVDGSTAIYRELVPDVVIAAHGRIAAVSDEAPIFALPYPTLRGFPGGKYLNNVAWQAQTELRLAVFWRIGVVAFAGAGQVAPKAGQLIESELLYSGGAGIRVVVSESERINCGIDFARASDGDSAVYFRIGEAF